MRVTAKVDYAVRALMAIAAIERQRPCVAVKRDAIAAAEAIPPAYLEDILRSMRNGRLVRSQRGAEGGWRLARPPEAISVADVIRVVEGPLANVRGLRPHELAAEDANEARVRLWVAVRTALRSVLEHVTIAHLVDGRLPADVDALADTPDAWSSR
ncbi:MAG: RrF2 family transcriptional regulator [Acidimicrobiales bacterium]